MRMCMLVLFGVVGFGTVASAQSISASKGFAEAVAQSAFGNVTSQSFGGEIGVSIAPGWQVFIDAGQVRDGSPSELGASSQAIAGFLSQTQSNVSFHVKEPIAFGVAGVRHSFPSSSRVEPYVLAGAGAARVKRDVSFTIAGNDVTSTIQQYGVALGSDLSGAETRPMLSLGGGVAWPAWQRLVVDFQYRYGRVFASDQGINVNRAGIGLGVRF